MARPAIVLSQDHLVIELTISSLSRSLDVAEVRNHVALSSLSVRTHLGDALCVRCLHTPSYRAAGARNRIRSASWQCMAIRWYERRERGGLRRAVLRRADSAVLLKLPRGRHPSVHASGPCDTRNRSRRAAAAMGNAHRRGRDADGRHARRPSWAIRASRPTTTRPTRRLHRGTEHRPCGVRLLARTDSLAS